MKKLLLNYLFASALALFQIAGELTAQSMNLAKDFYQHNLKERALIEFITILNSPNSSAEVKSEALYYMGQISFESGRYSIALDDWKRIINDYPTSKRATEIKDRLIQLKDVFSKVSDETISSTIARSYLKNGDFWADEDKTFLIDASWLPKVEMAIDWYDRVIKEFPGSDAAEIAYHRKLFCILGWKESGQYGNWYGLKYDFKKYLPILLNTFDEFEKAFPNSSYLQGFRYQISQVYWGKKDWENTRKWLNKIIEMGQGQSSFYTETAKARLNKVEY